MDKMFVAVFDSERQAYEGYRVLQDLHAEGSITLYAQAVIAKDAQGKVTIKEAADPGPLGTAVGVVAGALVGLLGGPMGVAVGAAAGMLGGATYDATNAVVSAQFVDEATARLEPGKAAVIAEIQEEWVLPLDARMEVVGETVLRQARGDVVDAQIARDVAALEADVAAMEAEARQASAEAEAQLRARIDAARAELQRVQDRATSSVEAAQREAEAKLTALKEQAAGVRAEQKQQLETREAEVRAAHEERKAKLSREALTS
jgi:uncharacterized membrane protein